MPRILIVKTTSLGDVIHNLPVIHDLQQHLQGHALDWLVEESFADIPRLHPGVSGVLTSAVRRWRKQLFSAAAWRQMTALRQQLQACHYTLVLDTQGLLKSAVLARCANAPRHGYHRDSAREPLAAALYDVTHRVAKNQHAVARNRALAALAFSYDIPTSTPCYGIQAESNAALKLPAAYIMGMHGSSRETKLWPTEYWITLARQLYGHKLALVLPWGSAAEYRRAAHIASQTPQTVVLPQMRLSALAGAIAGARAAVGVDTGLMHLAVALGKPSIALFTDTDPALTGLYPGAGTIGINLGGKDQLPTVADVIRQLQAGNII